MEHPSVTKNEKKIRR